jgi:hypothetical protein
MPDRFVRWSTEGQLATLVMAIFFVTWLGFQIFVGPLDRPTVLNEALLMCLGAWITNVGYGIKKRDDRKETAQADEDERLAAKVAALLKKEGGGKHRAPMD